MFAVGQPLDGGDLTLSDIDRQSHARKRRHLVQPNRASRTGSAIADDFRASQVQVIAKSLRQGSPGLHGHFVALPIDKESDWDRVRAQGLVFMNGRMGLAVQDLSLFEDQTAGGRNPGPFQESPARYTSLLLIFGQGLPPEG